jgi:hypothetical protein
VYCGLALHHAKLYDKIRRSEQKNKAGSTYIHIATLASILVEVSSWTLIEGILVTP